MRHVRWPRQKLLACLMSHLYRSSSMRLNWSHRQCNGLLDIVTSFRLIGHVSMCSQYYIPKRTEKQIGVSLGVVGFAHSDCLVIGVGLSQCHDHTINHRGDGQRPTNGIREDVIDRDTLPVSGQPASFVVFPEVHGWIFYWGRNQLFGSATTMSGAMCMFCIQPLWMA